MTASPPASAAFEPHDHRKCRRAVRARVEAVCAARNLKLTPPRACVLDALLESHQAMTAYELLDRLRAAGLGSQPPVVYRALAFLSAHGFVHRIERLSAFVACPHGGEAHSAAFLVCGRCRQVAEANLPGADAALVREADAHAFRVERVTIEAEGVCARCREAAE